MLHNLRFMRGMAMIVATLALANLSSSTYAAETETKAPAVKVTMSAQAKKLLDKHGMTLEGGILRKRGEKDGAGFAIRSNVLHVVIHPKDNASLAIANYIDGRLDVVLTVGFDKHGTVVSPFNEPDDVIAKLFPPLVSDAPYVFGSVPQGQSCKEIKLAQKVKDLAGTDFVSSPCHAFDSEALSNTACDTEKVWASLRQLYIRQLTSVLDDDVGRDSAEFLRTSSVTLKAIDMSLKMGPGTRALYEPQTDRVELPVELFKPLWPLLRGSNLSPEATKVVEVTAPSLVHELRHARQVHTLGFADPGSGFIETEGLAYVDEALFLWARLEHDPDYAGMWTFDRVLMSTAGLPATTSPWWKQPLNLSDLPRLDQFRGAAKTLMGKSLQKETVNNWLFARSLAGGLDGMETIMRWMLKGSGPTTSAINLPVDFLKESAADNKIRLEKLKDCRDKENEPSDKQYFDTLIKEREEDLRFYEDPSKHERLVRYFKAERARQQEMLDRRLYR